MNLKVTLFTSLLFLICGTTVAQPYERIERNFAAKLSARQPSDKVKVIMMMADQVDIDALDAQLTARRVSPFDRHRTVLNAMKQKAQSTQGAILNSLAQRRGLGKVVSFEPMWLTNLIVAEMDKETIIELSSRSDIKMIYEDGIIELDEPVSSSPARSMPNGSEAGLRAIGAQRLWDLGFTGNGSLVMGIDSGVRGTHPALNRNWRGNQPGMHGLVLAVVPIRVMLMDMAHTLWALSVG
jgi:hypothetical protein